MSSRRGRATSETALARLERPWGIVLIKAETLTHDPYYRHLRQGVPLEQDQQEWNRVAADQQLPPSPKGSDYRDRPWVYVAHPVGRGVHAH